MYSLATFCINSDVGVIFSSILRVRPTSQHIQSHHHNSFFVQTRWLWYRRKGNGNGTSFLKKKTLQHQGWHKTLQGSPKFSDSGEWELKYTRNRKIHPWLILSFFQNSGKSLTDTLVIGTMSVVFFWNASDICLYTLCSMYLS